VHVLLPRPGADDCCEPLRKNLGQLQFVYGRLQAALNSKSPFITPFGREQEADTVKRAFKVENSDFLTVNKVISTSFFSQLPVGHCFTLFG
jgi:hypothetical protein